MRTDDGELVTRAAGGDGGAFGELVRRYRGMVYGAAYHYLGSADDAQDIAQEAFVQAYGRLSQLREPSKFAPWLRRLAQNLCAMHLRRQGVLLTQGEDIAPDYRPGEDTVERLTTRLAVREALGRLSDKTRLTVTLSYLGGYSHAEVAAFLDIPLATVRSRLQHAKRQLRQEMRAMITDTLNQGRPDETWTRQVVEAAMRRGREAAAAYDREQALRCYDEALTAIDTLPPGEDQTRLKMQALWRKGDAADPLHFGSEDGVSLREQALALAEELDDRRSQAEQLTALGGAFYNASQPGDDARVTACFERALALYGELGDPTGQARCLTNLATGRLWGDGDHGRGQFTQARDLYERAGDLNGATYCRAMLDVMAEVGPENLAVHRLPDGNLSQPIIGFYAGCDIFEVRDGRVRHPGETCYIGYTWPDELAHSPLRVQRVFEQASQLRKILDESVPVGGSWSGSAFSNSPRPLLATVTVLSDTESVIVPAGTFDGCLLTEQVTTEDGPPNEANEGQRGTVRAWYAPGVGLAQLQARHDDGSEATIQLQEYTIAQESNAWLPFAVGNRWQYGWADVPPQYLAKEVYHITAHRDDLWYVEHYAYADQRR